MFFRRVFLGLVGISAISGFNGNVSELLETSENTPFAWMNLRMKDPEVGTMNVDQFPELYFDQLRDHYSVTEETYPQRYFVNTNYYRPGGPAFLFIGGEGKLSPLWVDYGQLAKAAQLHGGVVFALEHRFYGKSYPTDDLSVESLILLSSDQAIRDIAYFIQNIKIPYPDDEEIDTVNKLQWIVAGGSYPGNLAAWSRHLYPMLISGAIASSAPVQAKSNFFEYDLQVQKSLKRHGGSKCLQYFIDIFEMVDKELLSSDPKRHFHIKQLFGLEDQDNGNFALELDIVSGFVQYNHPTQQNLVAGLCNSLNLHGNRLDKLIEFSRIIRRARGRSSSSRLNQIKNILDQAKVTTIPDEDTVFRQWLYQCCTEFGYWQVAPTSYPTARSKLITEALWDTLACKAMYGQEFDAGPDINTTNRHYHGKQIHPDGILFINGELDPWQPLSIPSHPSYQNKNMVPPIIITNASHAMDLGQDSQFDWPQLKQAKHKMQKFIKKLIDDEKRTQVKDKPKNNFTDFIPHDWLLVFSLILVGLALVAKWFHAKWASQNDSEAYIDKSYSEIPITQCSHSLWNRSPMVHHML